MAKNCFAAEGTFNNKIIVLKIDILHEIFQNTPDFKQKHATSKMLKHSSASALR